MICRIEKLYTAAVWKNESSIKVLLHHRTSLRVPLIRNFTTIKRAIVIIIINLIRLPEYKPVLRSRTRKSPVLRHYTFCLTSICILTAHEPENDLRAVRINNALVYCSNRSGNGARIEENNINETIHFFFSPEHPVRGYYKTEYYRVFDQPGRYF